MPDSTFKDLPCMTIGTLSRRSRCKIETIRYYERIGLMPAPARTEGGHRVYGTRELKRLTFIRRGRELEFGLDAVRSLLDLADNGGGNCQEVRAITLAHVHTVRDKIADLQRLAGVLEQTAARCDIGDNTICPVIEALYRQQN